MNKLTDFMTKRKKDNRQSLIIDNFNYQTTISQEELNFVEPAILPKKPQTKSLSEQDKIESFSEDSFEDQMAEPWKINNDVNINSVYSDDLYTDESVKSSIVNKNIKKFEQPKQKQKSKNVNVNHDCYKCKNGGNKNDPFMILNCGHIFHIGCLVEIHFDEFTNCGGIIDEKFINNCICMVCEEPMEVEDILHMHNKFTKSTKEQLKYQTDSINVLDKQLTKLKDEMRIQLEYKQRLEDKRSKSKQITITLNNLL